MKKKIILLNGPSSSGKSTLAGSLQRMIKEKKNEEFITISIDDFLKMTTSEKIYEDDVYEINERLCEECKKILDTKQGVIIDHVITSKRILEQFKDRFNWDEICMVRIDCPTEELRRREKGRKDRCLGSAESSYQYLYPKEGYDLTVNTFELSQIECCLKVLDFIK